MRAALSTGFLIRRIATSALGAALLLAGCAHSQTLVPDGGFVEPLGTSHALRGRIYDVRDRAFASAAKLEAAVAGAEFIVLGETHDNRDHHALEALLVAQFLDSHAGAGVAFEMLDEDDRAALAIAPRDPDALARAVDWDQSGWPEFSQYRPVFSAALSRSARVIAAHPSSEHVHASLAGVPEAEAHELHLDVAFSEPVRAQLREEIRASHCGQAPAPMLDAMEHAQSYKDAFMARAIANTHTPVVLVTGRGHARNDRAVPYFLRARGKSNVLSVALVDVDDAQPKPEAYDVAAFDYVIFTPRVTDEDPCVRFREELRKMKQHAAE